MDEGAGRVGNGGNGVTLRSRTIGSGFGERGGVESEERESGGSSPLSAQSRQSQSPDRQSASPVHVVRHCDPVDSEPDLLIDTEALHQRYRFFEEFREPVKQPKRFIMTPPRDVPRTQSPDDPVPPRDPNVVRSSDKVVDDIPKTDTAKKMLNVFKRLESQTDGPADRPEPKLTDDVPVEPEMARSLRAKFENWTTDAERDNNNKSQSNSERNSPSEETPQLDTTRKMLVVFQQLESQTRYCVLLSHARPPAHSLVPQQERERPA